MSTACYCLKKKCSCKISAVYRPNECCCCVLYPQMPHLELAAAEVPQTIFIVLTTVFCIVCIYIHAITQTKQNQAKKKFSCIYRLYINLYIFMTIYNNIHFPPFPSKSHAQKFSKKCRGCGRFYQAR